MISFKDFLMINEDIQTNAIEKVCNGDFDLIFKNDLNNPMGKKIFNDVNSLIKTKTDEVKNKLKNKGIPDNKINNNLDKENARIFKDYDELLTKTKKVYSDNRTKSAKNGDIADVKEKKDKIEDFYRIIYSNRKIIDKLSPYTASIVRKAFENVDVNKDHKIDKNELKEAIKNLQNNKSISNHEAAFVAYLMYLKNAGGSGFAITDEGKLTNDPNSKPDKIFSDDDKEIKDYFSDAKIEELNKKFKEIVAETKGYKFETSILKNFNTFQNAIDVFSGKKELTGNFVNKTPTDKANDKIKDLNKEIDDLENEKKLNNQEIKNANDEIEEIKNKNEKLSTDELGKGSWFSFDVIPPDIGDAEGLSNFFNFILKDDKGALGKLRAIEKESKSFQKEPKHKKDDLKLDENIVLKIAKKNGFKTINEEDNTGFDSGNEKINDVLNTAKQEIENLTNKYKTKLEKLNAEYESSDDYNKSSKLKLKFKLEMIDYGSKVSQLLVDVKNNLQADLKKAKLNKFNETVSNNKSLKEQGQEDLDVKKIHNILQDTNYMDDSKAIAKFMLANLLKENDSEKIFEMLNDKSFTSSSAWSKYIYIGDDKRIYALNKNSVKEDKWFKNIIPNAKVLICGSAKVYRNPKELLSAAGIDINRLSVDILKRVKVSLKDSLQQAAKDAEAYLTYANELRQKIAPRSSVVSEGLISFLKGERKIKSDKDIENSFNNKNKDQENNDKRVNSINSHLRDQNNNTQYGTNFDNNEKAKQTVDQNNDNIIKSTFEKSLNDVCTQLNIDARKFSPDGNGIEDIATRQIFKGFVFIEYNGSAYFTTTDRLEQVRKELKQAVANKNKDNSKFNKAETNVKEQANNFLNNNQTNYNDWNSSIVTSSAADSTYGNGYNYNKKADAIKKKLNCTTYTYFPNSKLKIVRRTFD